MGHYLSEMLDPRPDENREIVKRSTSIDRKKEICTAFANWINKFYVAVSDYEWVAVYSSEHITKRKTTVELYTEFIKKVWK